MTTRDTDSFQARTNQPKKGELFRHGTEVIAAPGEDVCVWQDERLHGVYTVSSTDCDGYHMAEGGGFHDGRAVTLLSAASAELLADAFDARPLEVRKARPLPQAG